MPTVGLVIRLDAEMTTLNLIQSRGRARAHYSKYFVLLSPGQEMRVQVSGAAAMYISSLDVRTQLLGRDEWKWLSNM